jgi:HlyD family secretion protein
VRFTVDAHPDMTFKGTVAQIRLNATMTQNVVTYTVVINTDNSDGKLLPYLTANLQFQVGQKQDVLLVPNSALRWKPQPNQVVPDQRAAYAQSLRTKDATPGDKPAAEPEHPNQGVVWVREGNFVRSIAVHTGLSDGVFTEITGNSLPDGTKVVIGMAAAKDASASTSTSPFTPQMFKKAS